jgi:hypothetical protein
MNPFDPVSPDEEPAGLPPDPNWLAIIMGLLIAGAGGWALFRNGEETLLKLGLLSVYLALSSINLPEPDYSDMGWLGGMMDDPFRLSDNRNRTIVMVNTLFLPGRLVTYTIGLISRTARARWEQRRRQ